jgi:hypothetical protein
MLKKRLLRLAARDPNKITVKIYVAGKEESISLANFREIVIQSLVEAVAGGLARIILKEWKKRKARRDEEEED